MNNQAPTPETDAFFACNTSLMQKWAQMSAFERQRDEARAVLKEIARQHLADEMDDDTRERADWEGGFEELIKIARAAVAPTPNPEP